jgi:hypothetical protein
VIEASGGDGVTGLNQIKPSLKTKRKKSAEYL